MTDPQRRLYRSHTNKIIAGVCGGLSEYFNIDVTVVRLVWILLTFFGGSGIIVYILAYFIVPLRPIEASAASQPIKTDFTAARIFGIIFVAIGVVILLDNLDILSFHHWWNMSWEFVFPGILILAGLYFLTKRDKIAEQGGPAVPPTAAETDSHDKTTPSVGSPDELKKPKMFRRSLKDKKILGICGGAGEYFDIDPTMIRIGYAIFTMLSGGMGIIIYLLMYLVVPEDQASRNKQ